VSTVDTHDAGDCAAAQTALDRMRERWAASRDDFDVLSAVAHVFAHNLIAPSWLSGEFSKRRDQVLRAERMTWDEVFGRPWPKGTRQQSVRRDIELRKRVYSCAWQLVREDPTRSINRILFDEVSELLGDVICGSKAEKLYYEAIKDGRHVDLKAFRESQRSCVSSIP
jgi:hypothetical protein